MKELIQEHLIIQFTECGLRPWTSLQQSNNAKKKYMIHWSCSYRSKVQPMATTISLRIRETNNAVYSTIKVRKTIQCPWSKATQCSMHFSRHTLKQKRKLDACMLRNQDQRKGMIIFLIFMLCWVPFSFRITYSKCLFFFSLKMEIECPQPCDSDVIYTRDNSARYLHVLLTWQDPTLLLIFRLL